MRLERIRSLGDFGEFCLDQLGHGALVVAISWVTHICGGPAFVGWVFGTWILVVRELWQRTQKDHSNDWVKVAPWAAPFIARWPLLIYIDSVVDVVAGMLLSVWYPIIYG